MKLTDDPRILAEAARCAIERFPKSRRKVTREDLARVEFKWRGECGMVECVSLPVDQITGYKFDPTNASTAIFTIDGLMYHVPFPPSLVAEMIERARKEVR